MIFNFFSYRQKKTALTRRRFYSQGTHIKMKGMNYAGLLASSINFSVLLAICIVRGFFASGTTRSKLT